MLRENYRRRALEVTAPLVSIVTICFNQATYIREAIESVLSQDYEPIEYVVVDAGSSDGSREIIETYRSRLAAVIFEPDDGPADGLNKGFNSTSGEILGYLNADDAYLPGAVAGAVESLAARPHVAAVYGHGFIVDSNGRPLRYFRSSPFSPRLGVYGAAVVMQQATFFRRAAWIGVRGFNTSNSVNWDTELLMDLALAKKPLARVDEEWGLFRVHGDSISTQLWRGASDETSARVMESARANRERIFVKVMKRQPRSSDKQIRVAARIYKWVLDPAAFVNRLQELIFKKRSLARLDRKLASVRRDVG